VAVGIGITTPVFTGLDSNGNAVGAGKLYTYQPGTTTTQTTYSDSTLATPNSNPITLDASGRATVYLDASLGYKFILKDSALATLWTQDSAYLPPSPVRANVYNSTTQSLANNTATQLTFNTETTDIGSLHSAGVFTVPTGQDGWYLGIGAVTFASNATGQRYLYWQKNGAATNGMMAMQVGANAAGATGVTASCMVALVAGDTLSLVALQNSGGALNTGDASAPANRNTAQVIRLC
jgi:hypothetical protein